MAGASRYIHCIHISLDTAAAETPSLSVAATFELPVPGVNTVAIRSDRRLFLAGCWDHRYAMLIQTSQGQ